MSRVNAFWILLIHNPHSKKMTTMGAAHVNRWMGFENENAEGKLEYFGHQQVGVFFQKESALRLIRNWQQLLFLLQGFRDESSFVF